MLSKWVFFSFKSLIAQKQEEKKLKRKNLNNEKHTEYSFGLRARETHLQLRYNAF